MWRNAVAALIVAAGGAAIYRFCVVPYRCSMVERQIELRTDEALQYATPSYVMREAARQRIARLAECIDRDPTNVNFYMLAAANERIVHNDRAAAALYQRALEYDRRPEIYLNLGLVQAATDEPDKAVQNLVMAGDFSGKELLLDLPDVATRMRAYAIVAANEAKLLAKYGAITRRSVVLNATFEKPGPRNPLTVDTSAPPPWSTAAAYWYVLGGPTSEVTTEIVPSTRRRGGKMLHVTATKGSLIYQDLTPTGGQLANALTDAWVFVRDGQIWVASGNGYSTTPDATSTATRRWERLQSRNGTCPVTEIRIVAATERADFYVDAADVFEVAGPVCGDAR